MTLKVVITGGDGFIGRNLRFGLSEAKQFEPRPLGAASSPDELATALIDADFLIHLAGVNRPKSQDEFMMGNRDAVIDVINAVKAAGRKTPILLASSTQAESDNPYGQSKRAGEDALLDFAEATANPVHIFRLPNVFGKWARPNYNSAVATFCYNIARDLPITVHDPDAPLSLVYIDDVVDAFIDVVLNSPTTGIRPQVSPVYKTSVGAVAELIRRFHQDRDQALIENVGTGLTRALYATYISALPPEKFTYPLTVHADARGSFSEILKTPAAGQFSFFTAHPGVTRGGHYHHTKTEKFLVVQGEALFKFRHMVTGERQEFRTSGQYPSIVETIPGWTHDITNVGESELVSLLWANEIFDAQRPDTTTEKV